LTTFRFFRAGLILLLSATGGITGIYAVDISENQAYQVLSDINEIRAGYGLQELQAERASMKAAGTHARDLEERQTLSHWGSDGSRVIERYRTAGGTGLTAGENLGAGDSVTSIIEAWMQSPAHRDNLLRADWFSAGVGYQQTGNGRIVLVVVFNNSRWEQISRETRNGEVFMEGLFLLSPGTFPEDMFITVNGVSISPAAASLSEHNQVFIKFQFPEPEEWDRNRIAAVPFSVMERGSVYQTDLILLQ
jgi:hypothetical protein